MPSTNATRTLLAVLEQFLREEASPAFVAAGYSGGLDSTVLLWALVRVCGPERVTAVHVDHGWRPVAEREQELATVRSTCLGLGIALVTFPAPEAVERSEEAARRHRYQCFEAFLQRSQASTVFLAHHADDQAETVLMRLLKGRSWSGLGGISARRGPFRRPFLPLRRQVLEQCAVEQGLRWHEDSTNLNLGPTRNLLRHQVFPVVLDRFPRAVEALNEFSRVWGERAPKSQPNAAWIEEEGRARVSARLWDDWSPLQRQAELLALLRPVHDSTVVSRRFLEHICADGGRGVHRAGKWTWSRVGAFVLWESVDREPQKEYFVVAVEGRWYDVGSYRWSWTSEGPGTLRVNSLDGDREWVWRSLSSGLRLSSVDDPDWGRDKRRKRLGSLAPERVALLIQDGLVRAVVDPRGKHLLWSESGGEKLNKREIFVTLVTATRNMTE